MLDETKVWINHLDENSTVDLLPAMCKAFNNAPFMCHNNFMMQVNEAGDNIECKVDMQDHMVGNVHFGILHGGVAATILDSIGGLQGMIEIFKQGRGEFADMRKKVGRLATMDMRIDYLAPGKGKSFTATAEVIRLGSKSCTCRMQLVNDAGKLIAIGTASYVF